MLQRLTIATVQVKAGKSSENLINEIREIIYFLFQAKEITKKLYDVFNKGIIQIGYYIFEF